MTALTMNPRTGGRLTGLVSCTDEMNNKEMLGKITVDKNTISLVKTDEATLYEKFMPYCAIMLDGRYQVRALVDSGNVTVNAMSEKLATQIFGKNVETFLTPIKIFIGTAKQGEGGQLQILGRVKRPMTLQFVGVRKTFQTRPLVIRDFTNSFNLAGTFLAYNKIDHLYSKKCLKIGRYFAPLLPRQKGPTVQLVEASTEVEIVATGQMTSVVSVGQAAAAAAAAADGQTTKVARKKAKETKETQAERFAYVAETIEIPAHRGNYMKIKIPDIQKLKIPEGDGLLEVNGKFLDRNACHPTIAALVRTCKDGFAYTTVVNAGEKPVVIKEGQIFGTYHPRVVPYREFANQKNVDQHNVHTRVVAADRNRKNVPPKTPTTRTEKIAWLSREFKLD